MIAIHLDHVSVTYIAKPIFSDLSWEIQHDRCVGLIGPNGTGKSTLLKLIAGEVSADSGFVHRHGKLSVGYLHQEPRLTPGLTVWEEALGASHDLRQIEERLHTVEQRLGDPQVYGDEDKLTQALDEQARLIERFEELGGANYEGTVRSTLLRAGFAPEEFDLPVEVLSGGQKKLLGLAKILITKPAVLLLDEPDNHLDLTGKALLERLINDHNGATILVSHDRYLLDLTVDEITELEDGRLKHYPGDYSEYVFEKRSSLLRQQQLFQAQQKEIDRLEQAAHRLLVWGRVYDNEKLIKRGKNILTRLDRIERIERPVLERRRMELELRGWRGSNKVLEIRSLEKSFLERADETEPQTPSVILAGLNLLLWRGERVGLIGANGSGKSVLFRLILGQDEPTSGTIELGPSVSIGHYAQEHQTLDYNKTLIDTVRSVNRFTENEAVAFLAKFLFDYERARGPVKNLSGGERSRLQMALLRLSNANFLLLDEPTNNLDIASAEVLEDALNEFDGTVLVISHDRYFLDRTVTRIVEMVDGRLVEYKGGYSDYLQESGRSVKQKDRRTVGSY